MNAGMPAQLFKYRPWLPRPKKKADGSYEERNFTERLLLDQGFYCQQPRGFDDPHDSHTGAVPTGSVHDIDRYAVENMALVSATMRSERLTSLTQLVTSNTPEATAARASLAGWAARRQHFIVSLSAVGDNDLMWTFYSDEHRGICLEFDGNHPVFAQVREVSYAAIPPGQSAGSSDSDDPLIFHKAASLAFQEEWRMVSATPLFSFPAEALKRVILGYRFPDAAFEQLTQTLVAGRYSLVIDQMQRLSGSYDLVPVRRGTIG
jgi:hypothetical protein